MDLEKRECAPGDDKEGEQQNKKPRDVIPSGEAQYAPYNDDRVGSEGFTYQLVPEKLR